jgi:hypothetical protein
MLFSTVVKQTRHKSLTAHQSYSGSNLRRMKLTLMAMWREPCTSIYELNLAVPGYAKNHRIF